MSAVTFAVSKERLTGPGVTDPIIALQTAAEAKDEYAFGLALQAVDGGKRPPSDFVHAVDLALMAGAYLAARRLASQGAIQYPHQPELQKLAQLLAPPQVTVGTGGPQVGVEANRVWLRTNWNQYRGQWVRSVEGNYLVLPIR
jgi:hypothetical protein